jgi:hypothetical protein
MMLLCVTLSGVVDWVELLFRLASIVSQGKSKKTTKGRVPNENQDRIE